MARLALLLPALLCSWMTPAAAESGSLGGKCGSPMQIKNAEIEVTGSTRLRYSCVKDYKRKAGTSNLIVCKQDGVTKQYHWTGANLNCIRDPSKPALPGTTEDSRQKAETSAPTRKPAAPQTSVNAAMVSIHFSGSPTTDSAPAASTTGTILPTTGGSSPEASVVTATITEVIGWLSPGTVTENTTLQDRTTRQDSQARTNSQPSFKPSAAQNRSTAGPSKGIPLTEGLERWTGSPSVQIVLPCLGGLVVILCTLIWCFYVRVGRLPWHSAVPRGQEISMPVMRSEERGRTSPTDCHLGDPGPCDEGAQMLSPHCALATG